MPSLRARLANLAARVLVKRVMQRPTFVLADARRFVEAAQAAGVAVEFHPRDGLAHDWQLMGPLTPESVASTRRLGRWVAARLREGA